MAADRDAPSGRAPHDPKTAREAKLAEALRANLRRRKAEPKREPVVAPKPERGESG